MKKLVIIDDEKNFLDEMADLFIPKYDVSILEYHGTDLTNELSTMIKQESCVLIDLFFNDSLESDADDFGSFASVQLIKNTLSQNHLKYEDVCIIFYTTTRIRGFERLNEIFNECRFIPIQRFAVTHKDPRYLKSQKIRDEILSKLEACIKMY